MSILGSHLSSFCHLIICSASGHVVAISFPSVFAYVEYVYSASCLRYLDCMVS